MSPLRPLALMLLPPLLLGPLTAARAEERGRAPLELSLYVEGSRHLGAGVRVDSSLGHVGPGRVAMGAELAAGHCARRCMRFYYGLFTPQTGELEPGQGEDFDLTDLLGDAEPPPPVAVQLLLPSLRASYHLDFRREGLFSLTDVYGLMLVGVAGAQSRYKDSPVLEPTTHRSWAPAIGVGLGVRQSIGQRYFLGLELRGRLGSGRFEDRFSGHDWTVSGPGLALSAGTLL